MGSHVPWQHGVAPGKHCAFLYSLHGNLLLHSCCVRAGLHTVETLLTLHMLTSPSASVPSWKNSACSVVAKNASIASLSSAPPHTARIKSEWVADSFVASSCTGVDAILIQLQRQGEQYVTARIDKQLSAVPVHVKYVSSA